MCVPCTRDYYHSIFHCPRRSCYWTSSSLVRVLLSRLCGRRSTQIISPPLRRRINQWLVALIIFMNQSISLKTKIRNLLKLKIKSHSKLIFWALVEENTTNQGFINQEFCTNPKTASSLSIFVHIHLHHLPSRLPKALIKAYVLLSKRRSKILNQVSISSKTISDGLVLPSCFFVQIMLYSNCQGPLFGECFQSPW